MLYSRRYIKLIDKKFNFKNITSIIDLGCGIGYTTAALKELLPNAKVIGTNLEKTKQYKIAKKVGEKYDFSLEPFANQQADMIFASEYFEHIESPIKHLEEIIKICNPNFLIIANSFGSQSMGHFNYYKVEDKYIKNKKIGRLFNNKLRTLGYNQLKTGFWNNRPTVWENTDHKKSRQ